MKRQSRDEITYVRLRTIYYLRGEVESPGERRVRDVGANTPEESPGASLGAPDGACCTQEA